MKKKIIIVLLILIFLLVVSKIFNFIIINKVYHAIEEFKENDNRYYSVTEKEKYSRKIFFKNGIMKSINSVQSDDIYCEWKNINTGENYTIRFKENNFYMGESANDEDAEILVNLPSILLNMFYKSDKISVSDFFKIKYIIPVKYENKNCFEIITNYEKLIVDVNTYLPIHLIREEVNSGSEEITYIETFYEFQTNTVTDEDITLPDLSEYQKIE